jgi:hypothetical protein
MPSSVVVAFFFFFFQISPVTHISMPISFIQYPPTAGKVTCRVRLSLQFFFDCWKSDMPSPVSLQFFFFDFWKIDMPSPVVVAFFFLSQISPIEYIPICIPDHWEHPYLRYLCAGINFVRATREAASVREILSLWALPRT